MLRDSLAVSAGPGSCRLETAATLSKIARKMESLRPISCGGMGATEGRTKEAAFHLPRKDQNAMMILSGRPGADRLGPQP